MSDDLILSEEVRDFLTNARVLELSEDEAQQQCKRFGLRPFWPVPVETLEFA
jgi:hypothetical protein